MNYVSSASVKMLQFSDIEKKCNDRKKVLYEDISYNLYDAIEHNIVFKKNRSSQSYNIFSNMI